jgi:hypothetical protein
MNKTTWAPVDSLTERTALGPRRPPQIVATTDLPHARFPAAISPPPDSLPRRPPSASSIGYKGSPPVNILSSSRSSPSLRCLVLPPLRHHVVPPLVPLWAPATATSTAPPCSTFPHREPLTIAPGRLPRRHSPPADRTSPWSSSFRWGPPFLTPPVGCAVLPSCPSAPPLPPPLPASRSRPGRRQHRRWPSALPLFDRDGPSAQSGWASWSRPAKFGPFAQYHLPFFHPIKHWLIQIKIKLKLNFWNCRELNKLNKVLISILYFELGLN